MAGGGGRYVQNAKSAAQFARRAAPVAIDLYRRWQALPPEQRERYIKTVREYVDRASTSVRDRRRKR
jgi:hypothetical protein